MEHYKKIKMEDDKKKFKMKDNQKIQNGRQKKN